MEYLLFASSLPDSKAPGEQAHPPHGACVQLTVMFKFLFGSLIHNRHKDKILKECTDLLRVLILQISSSLLQVWWNNLADGNRTMLRGISVGGLDCIAPYRPLRGFYCDLHINEHLSVCSRERLDWEQRSFSAAKAYLCNKHVKHAGLCSKGSHTWLRM